MKKIIPINDNWLFRPGFSKACLGAGYDYSDFYLAFLPHNNVMQRDSYFDEREQACECTYTRVLIVPQKYNGSKLLLRFMGIESYAEVYVNGIFVTSHKGDAPFDADITAPVRYDYENRIVVRVDSSLRKDVPCRGVRGPSLMYGGIHRDVFFVACDGTDIRDVFVFTPKVGEGKSSVVADVSLYDFYPDTQLGGVILAADGSVAGELSTKTVQGSQVRLQGCIEAAALWSPDSPVLYTAKITLFSAEKTLDEFTINFGFVSAKFQRDAFYLNGKPLRLIGLNREDSYPHAGKAMPSSQQREDARLIKSLGCNCVRSLGLASVDFIDECSRIGLMVIEDIAGDGYLGTGDWRDALVGSVRDMVLRDRSRPCVIAWGVRVNNSRDLDELYFKTTVAAHNADPTRATVGARNFMGSRLYEDVFAYNDYSPRGLSRRKKTGKLFVPYIVSEHTGKNYPVKPFDPESMRVEQALRHLEVISGTAAGRRTAGAFGMSLSDFAAARQRGSGDNVNYYGVTDLYRCPKYAAYAYASQGEAPVFELGGSLAPDEFEGRLYAFTNADSVRLYRDDALVREFTPMTSAFPGLKHPPIAIDDFIGNLPEQDGIKGFMLRQFKRLVRAADGCGSLLGIKRTDRIRLRLLTAALRLSPEKMSKLADKYSLNPPLGVTYRFEAVKNGEVTAQKVYSPDIRKTLRVECDSDALYCDKSYEVARFSVTAEDGNGNRLQYDFSPVKIIATGSVELIGSDVVSLKGGMAGFYVKSIGGGTGRVTVESDFGKKVIDLEVYYAAVEGF